MSARTGYTFVSEYEVLGVRADATIEEIKSAFRKLSLTHHPDKVHGTREATEEAHKTFVQIRKAYETLTDPAKREALNSELGLRGRSRRGSQRKASTASASSARQGSRNRVGGCDCGWNHGTLQETRDWIRAVLKPERLWGITYNLVAMEERLVKVRSWYRANYPSESKIIETLTFLADHIGSLEDVTIRALRREIQELPDLCGPLSRRDKLVDKMSKIEKKWWQWQAAEQTVGRYWDIMGDADSDEINILQASFLGLIERWLYVF